MDPSLLSSVSSRSRSASRSASGKTGGPSSTATSLSPTGPGSAAGSAADLTVGTAVSPRADRPSFSSFWKRTRTAVTHPMSLVQPTSGRRGRAKKSSNTSASCSSKADGATPDASVAAAVAAPADATATTTTTTTTTPPPNQPLTAADKARIRRAQVRRAQIQHRQRKAAYQEQLEIDIDTLRWLIDAGAQDVQTMQDENAALREQVALLGLGDSSGGDGGSGNEAAEEVANAAADKAANEPADEPADELADKPADEPADEPVPSLFGDVDLDDVLVSMAVDDVLGVPVLRVASHGGDGGCGQAVAASKPEPALDDDSAGLALDLGQDLDLDLDLGLDTGNLVTAVSRTPGPGPVAPPVGLSAFPLLTTAQKDEVVNLILALEHVCWGHVGHQFQAPAPGTFCADTGHILMASSLVLRSAPDPVYTWMNETDVPAAPAAPAATTATTDVAAPFVCTAQLSGGAVVTPAWQASGVSLETLYGLAVALNGQSDQELAPVQAWFELAARFPLEVLLRADMLATLKRELMGVVTCLYFGAVMERRAFESVVERVVVPVVEAEEL